MVPIGFIDKVVFRPGNAGLAKMFGANEPLILEALWESGPLPGRRLYEEVRRSKRLAYTTVLTLVGRMVKKGSVRRRRVDGLYYYEAALSKSELARHASAAVIRGILEVSPGCAVSAFVDALSQYEPDRLDEVMKIIKEMKKEEGR
jgi:predicted transcriptional regulator